LNIGICHALTSARPDVILCGGYNYVASWQALLWARLRGTPFFLWSESNLQDLRPGHALVEFLKIEFLRQCSGFVVPGRTAREYLRSHKIREDVIFRAVNAVDNDLFASASAAARRDAVQLRASLGLPNRYFLFSGRLVREKGVFELLSSYAKLEDALREQIGLVFVGDGAARQALEAESSLVVPGAIRFAGFVQREQLAAYYALSETLILPTYTDTWGFVVNEAMACGLPVILSHAAGCGADLVTESWNGRMVPPKDVQALNCAMRSLANQPELCGMLGANSRKRISDYSPQGWCEGIARMMEAAGGSRD
jgi:glycosyltransferase involved in cell wall biosynthesis